MKGGETHPAFTWTPQCESREIDDPTVFVIPTIRAPRDSQYRIAASVSAVSPDCEMKKQTSSRKTGHSRSRKSDATSTMTGSSVVSSSHCRVAMAELYDVPHAMKRSRRHRFIVAMWSVRPPSTTCGSQASTAAVRQRRVPPQATED